MLYDSCDTGHSEADASATRTKCFLARKTAAAAADNKSGGKISCTYSLIIPVNDVTIGADTVTAEYPKLLGVRTTWTRRERQIGATGTVGADRGTSRSAFGWSVTGCSGSPGGGGYGDGI